MGMAYVVGTIQFTCGDDQKIIATLEDMEVVRGPRPKSASEIEGCDQQVLECLNTRESGTYSTRTRLGSGCALIGDIRWLSWGNERVLGNLRREVPELFDSEGTLVSRHGLICLWRDLEAPGTSACADVCAGVPEVTDILAGAFNESVEAGLHTVGADGVIEPARLELKGNRCQSVINDAANREWGRLYGVSVHFPHTIPVTVMGVDTDSVNGIPCIISSEPRNGSTESIIPLLCELTDVEGGWRWRDTEHREDHGKWVPLNRRPILIIPDPGDAPIMLGFSSSGPDVTATISYLEGKNLRAHTNGKVRSVLRALGWLQ